MLLHGLQQVATAKKFFAMFEQSTISLKSQSLLTFYYSIKVCSTYVYNPKNKKNVLIKVIIRAATRQALQLHRPFFKVQGQILLALIKLLFTLSETLSST